MPIKIKSFVYLLLLCAAAHSHAEGENLGPVRMASAFFNQPKFIYCIIVIGTFHLKNRSPGLNMYNHESECKVIINFFTFMTS